MAETEELAGGVFERLSPQETQDAINRGEAVLLDIRNVEEFAAERIPGAMLAPMPELLPVTMPAQGEKKIILQCRSGARTRTLAEQLISAGVYDRMAHLEGGIIAWKQATLPYIAFDPAYGGVRLING